jgi:hypothetical protein
MDQLWIYTLQVTSPEVSPEAAWHVLYDVPTLGSWHLVTHHWCCGHQDKYLKYIKYIPYIPYIPYSLSINFQKGHGHQMAISVIFVPTPCWLSHHTSVFGFPAQITSGQSRLLRGNCKTYGYDSTTCCKLKMRYIYIHNINIYIYLYS